MSEKEPYQPETEEQVKEEQASEKPDRYQVVAENVLRRYKEFESSDHETRMANTDVLVDEIIERVIIGRLLDSSMEDFDTRQDFSGLGFQETIDDLGFPLKDKIDRSQFEKVVQAMGEIRRSQK